MRQKGLSQIRQAVQTASISVHCIVNLPNWEGIHPNLRPMYASAKQQYSFFGHTLLLLLCLQISYPNDLRLLTRNEQGFTNLLFDP